VGFISLTFADRSPRAGTRLSQTVLIGDDEPEVAHTCARVLKKAGFECLIAHDSPDALALLDSGQPSLVLCDINLPTRDGFDVARQAHEKAPETPIILMTGNQGIDLPTKAAEVGAHPPRSSGYLIQAPRTSICRGLAFSFFGNSSSSTPFRRVALIFDSSMSSCSTNSR
jgi:CheY-like chemotaxis protein